MIFPSTKVDHYVLRFISFLTFFDKIMVNSGELNNAVLSKNLNNLSAN